MPNREKTTTYSELRDVYGEHYFQGATSGYGPGGYEKERPSWQPWLRLVQEALGDVRWLDVGCAYGYLIEEARELELSAFGIDVSPYALSRLPGAHSHLAAALAESLPARDASVDVLSLFDIIEHLAEPDLALAEARRVLREGGILILTTPDPIRFDRKEESHCMERPPCYWIERLQRLGFAVRVGFGALDYEILLAATPIADGETGPRQETLTLLESLVAIPNSANVPITVHGESLLAAPRGPWAVDGKDVVAGEGNEIYVAVTGETPCRVTVEVSLSTERAPRLTLDDLTLRHTGVSPQKRKGKANKQAKTATFLHTYEATTLWMGGHSLRLFPDTSERCGVYDIRLQGDVLELESARRRLPFDQFQRYRQLADILESCGYLAPGASVLEVGAKRSRLSAFLPQGVIYEGTDMEWDDVPRFFAADGAALERGDGTADIVAAIDVLEHVPAENRSAFLHELMRLARHTVIISGPFDTPCAAACDEIVQRFRTARGIGSHTYLAEHLTYGLPHPNKSLDVFSEAGWPVVVLPNGHVGWWVLGEILSHGLDLCSELAPGQDALHELLTTPFESADDRQPAYRHAIVATRDPRVQEILEEMQRVVWEKQPDGAGVDPMTFAAPLIQVFGLDVLRDREAAIGQRDDQIQRLLEHVSGQEGIVATAQEHGTNLEKRIRELAEASAKQNQHAENLAVQLKAFETEHASLIEHCRNLESQLEKANERHRKVTDHVQNLEKERSQAVERQAKLTDHAANLEKGISQAGERVTKLAEHAANLEKALKLSEGRSEADRLADELGELRQHTDAVQDALRESEAQRGSERQHATNLEQMMEEVRRHNRNLESILERRETEIADSGKQITSLQERLQQEQQSSTESQEALRTELERTQSELTELRDLWYVRAGRRLRGKT